ncbi:MAG: hypothetical protein WCP63_04335 [Cyanobium sp. ELA712]
MFGGVQKYRVDSSNNPCNQAPGDSQIFTYAPATLYTAPTAAPGPLPLFGAAAAFGFSRKLRKRLKLVPGALDSALLRA